MNIIKFFIALFLFSFCIQFNTAEAHFVYVKDGAEKPAFYKKAKTQADSNKRYIKIKENALGKMTKEHFEELETILIGVMHMDEKSQANYVNYVFENARNSGNPELSSSQLLETEIFNADGTLKDAQFYTDLFTDLMDTGNEFDKFMADMINHIQSEDNRLKKNGKEKTDGQLRGEMIGSIIGGVGGFVLGVIFGNPMKWAKAGAKVGKAIGGFFGWLFGKKGGGKKGDDDSEKPEKEPTKPGEEGNDGAAEVWAGPNNDEEHYGGMPWPF